MEVLRAARRTRKVLAEEREVAPFHFLALSVADEDGTETFPANGRAAEIRGEKVEHVDGADDQGIPEKPLSVATFGTSPRFVHTIDTNGFEEPEGRFELHGDGTARVLDGRHVEGPVDQRVLVEDGQILRAETALHAAAILRAQRLQNAQSDVVAALGAIVFQLDVDPVDAVVGKVVLQRLHVLAVLEDRSRVPHLIVLKELKLLRVLPRRDEFRRLPRLVERIFPPPFLLVLRRIHALSESVFAASR